MKYDKAAAQQLVSNMKSYEDEIMSTTRDLYGATKDSGWKDAKHTDFCRVLSSVVQDIKNGAYTIRDYKEHLDQRIRELE